MYINLYSEMKLKGVRQYELAERCGICLPLLNKKMRGKTRFWLDEAKAIAELLECPIEYLFEWKEQGK